MILEVPDSFTFQACSKERTDVGQKCNQPKEEQMEQVTNIVMITPWLGSLGMNQGTKKPMKPQKTLITVRGTVRPV